MSHAIVASRPPPATEPHNTLMESPTMSQYSSDSSDTGSSPGTHAGGRFDEDRLPLQTKDPKLQAYFFRMERALCTCHPAAIHAEALKLTQDILANPTDATSSIRTAAETLAKAGYRKVEYSRSCALMAYEIFCQLESISYDASVSFKDLLIGAVVKVFDDHYHKVIAYASRVAFLLSNRLSG